MLENLSGCRCINVASPSGLVSLTMRYCPAPASNCSVIVPIDTPFMKALYVAFTVFGAAHASHAVAAMMKARATILQFWKGFIM
jgi:hypothetical protein